MRLLGVLLTGALLFGVVVSSMWLTRADALVESQRYPDGYALPTPTLFPTRLYATPAPTRGAITTQTTEGSPSPTADFEVQPTDEIPVCEPPAGWEPRVVQEGDTLYTLANLVGTNLQALLQGNCLDAVHDLQAGETVYLPLPVRPSPRATAPPPPRCPGPPAGWRKVLVQPQETLYTLANRYGTTVHEVRRANCMTGDLIKAGQMLYLPPVMVVPPTLVPTPTELPTAVPSATPTAVSSVPTQPALTPTLTPTAPPPTELPTATPTAVPPTLPPSATPSVTPAPTKTPILLPTWTPEPEPTEIPTLTPTFTPEPPPPTATLPPPTATLPPTATPMPEP